MEKGNILVGTVIFIILNVLFLSLLVIFLITKIGGPAVLEEKYSKEIALMIDQLEPNSVIILDMSEAISKAENDYKGELIKIDNNVVFVKLREKGGKSYSFFNDVQANPSRTSKTHYVINILEKENVEE